MPQSSLNSAHADTSIPALLPKAALGEVLLLGLVFIVMFVGIGTYGLYEPHEAHFAGVGREMLLRGDWITPHLNGAPYVNKPPLLYWMVAASYSVLGINEFAARLPLVFIGFAGVLLAWHWARQLWGVRTGIYAAAIFASTVGWQLFCHQLLIDALLTVLNFAAMYALWRAIRMPQARNRWMLWYVLIAAGIMAKGLIGMAFPVMILFGFAFWRRDFAILKACRPVQGLLLVLLLVLPWVVALEMRNPGTLWYMLKNEHWDRLFDKRDPPDYSVVRVSALQYLGVTLAWLAPFSLLLPQIAGLILRKSARAQEPGPEQEQEKSNAVLILGLGAALPVLTFIPVPARLIYYSLPAIPPFVMLAAAWWTEADDERRTRGRWTAACAFALTGLAAVVIGVFFLAKLLSTVGFLSALSDSSVFLMRLAAGLGGGFMLCGVLLALRRSPWALGVLCAVLMGASLCNLAGFAIFDEVFSAKRLVLELDPKLGEDVIWVSEGSKEIGGSAGLSYYLGTGKDGQARTVLIMSDDPDRLPPHFPTRPNYLISHAQLDTLWTERPVVFVTDFQRDWTAKDAKGPWYPKGERFEVSVRQSGNRRACVNAAAQARLQASR